MSDIKLCVFDMGGVLVRNFNVLPKLSEFLGLENDFLPKYEKIWKNLCSLHGSGTITEQEFWERFSKETGKNIPKIQESLLGKFFTPTLDLPTYQVLEQLKKRGMRVVCGTNVIDSHYEIHNQLSQYDIFDKVYASHLVHIQKPDIEFYLKICENENVAPTQAFFTDDLEKNVLAAQTLGIHAFVYHSAKTLKEQLISLNIL